MALARTGDGQAGLSTESMIAHINEKGSNNAALVWLFDLRLMDA